MPNFSSETDVANAALSFLGEGPVADLNAIADVSDKKLTSLQQWYDKAVEMVIRDLNYELTVEFVTPVKLLDWPTPEWRAAYYLDPLWVKFHRIFSGAYPDSRETAVPHRKISQKSSTIMNITGVTIANPAVFSVANPQNGQVVVVGGIAGQLGLLLNNNTYFVSEATPTTCQLNDIVTGLPVDTSAIPCVRGIFTILTAVNGFEYVVTLNGNLYTYTAGPADTVNTIATAFENMFRNDPTANFSLVNVPGFPAVFGFAPLFTFAIAPFEANVSYATQPTTPPNTIDVYLMGGSLVPVPHQRILCNMRQGTDREGFPFPQFEVGIVPEVSLWPDDFGVCVATKLAQLAGVGIIGIDHKQQVDSLKDDYKTAKNNASANQATESFKGVRKLSASTLSRMPRRRRWNNAHSWGG